MRQSLFKVKFYELLAVECEKRFESEVDAGLKNGYEKLAKQSRTLVESESANYKKIQEEWEKIYNEEEGRMEEDFREEEGRMEKNFNDQERKMEENFENKREKARKEGDVLLYYKHKL